VVQRYSASIWWKLVFVAHLDLRRVCLALVAAFATASQVLLHDGRVRQLRCHRSTAIDQLYREIDHVVAPVKEISHDLEILVRPHLAEAVIEQLKDFVSVNLKALQRATKVLRIDATLITEALLNLAGGYNACSQLFIEQRSRILDYFGCTSAGLFQAR